MKLQLPHFITHTKMTHPFQPPAPLKQPASLQVDLKHFPKSKSLPAALLYPKESQDGEYDCHCELGLIY